MPGEQAEEIKIPSEAAALVAEFAERGKADEAMDRLKEAGFEDDQVSFVARGAEHVDGKFVPGALLITVHPDGRDEDADRILRECGATRVKSGTVSAIGEVTEIGEAERAEAAPS